MSQATSPSPGTPYGLARVCRVWGLARSTVYWQRHKRAPLGTRRGPLGPCADDHLVDHIQRVLEGSPFPGEGYRKVWARLRYGGHLAASGVAPEAYPPAASPHAAGPSARPKGP
jgi:putative transposase